MENLEERDGVLIRRNSKGEVVGTGVDSSKAIEKESDPRKCFLIAQLHAEYYVDMIISGYFSVGNNSKTKSIERFLKSKFMSFNDKIEFLKLLEDNSGGLLVNKSVINSLIVIAEIRNAFQHNLSLEEAILSLENNRRKMVVGGEEKKLNSYDDSVLLMNDFKIFFEWLYPKLIAIWIRSSFSEEEQKKFLRSVGK